MKSKYALKNHKHHSREIIPNVWFYFVFSFFCIFFALILYFIGDLRNQISDLNEKELEEKIQYRTELIELNNSNIFRHVNIIDYTCDEGVIFHKYDGSFYASTWQNPPTGEIPKVSYGKCFIKIKEEKK